MCLQCGNGSGRFVLECLLTRWPHSRPHFSLSCHRPSSYLLGYLSRPFMTVFPHHTQSRDGRAGCLRRGRPHQPATPPAVSRSPAASRHLTRLPALGRLCPPERRRRPRSGLPSAPRACPLPPPPSLGPSIAPPLRLPAAACRCGARRVSHAAAPASLRVVGPRRPGCRPALYQHLPRCGPCLSQGCRPSPAGL